MSLKGINSAQMQELATRFAGLGDKLMSNTEQLGSRIDKAANRLTQTMERLHGDGEKLMEENETVSSDLDRVTQATHWTGARGDRFREAEQTVVQAVNSTNSSNEEVMAQAKSVVEGDITSSMQESRGDALRAGQNGQQVSQGLGKKVSAINEQYSSVLGLG